MDASPDTFRVVGEADLLEMARVARSTWKNWAQSGLVDEPANGLYDEGAVVEAVGVSLLVQGLELRPAATAWRAARAAALDALDAARAANPDDVRLVVDPYTWELVVTADESSLLQQLERRLVHPRSQIVISVGGVAAEARRAFATRSAPAVEFQSDR